MTKPSKTNSKGNKTSPLVSTSHSKSLLSTLPSIKPIFALTLLGVTASLMGCGGSDDDTGQSSTPSTPKPPDVVDTNWQPAGGVATVEVTDENKRPFLQLIPTLPAENLQGVSQGRELFITKWTPAGMGRPLFDGLGPLFNTDACTECHSSQGRLPVYADNGQLTDAILFRVGNKQGFEHAYYGGQIQHKSVNSDGIDPDSLDAEGVVTYRATEPMDNYPAGIRFAFTPTNANQPLNNMHLSGRISPQLVGMGLLDLIPEANIIANADPNDNNEDGISGRVHWVFESGGKRVGRFGWKGINSSLRNQNANALSQDMGLTTTVFTEPNCSINQPLCWTLQAGGNPEVSDASLDAIVDFMTALAVPERRIDNLEHFNQGATLFAAVGCSNCHTPKHTTGISQRFSLLSNQTIYPYTDLLLHDMGEALDDGVKEENAESYEWRTPPLWGIGLVAAQPDARFLHDGRASSLKEAVLWHGGEAQTTKDRFVNLTEEEQEILLDFLKAI